MADIQNLLDVEIHEEVQKPVVVASQPDQQDFEDVHEDKQIKSQAHHEVEEQQVRSHTSVEQIKNLTHSINEQISKSAQLLGGTPQRTAVVEATQVATPVRSQVATPVRSQAATPVRSQILTTDQLRTLTQTVDEQLAKSAHLHGGSVKFSSTVSIQHERTVKAAPAPTPAPHVHYKSVSEVNHGLTNLHSQVDKIIGRSAHTASHTTVVPNVTARSLYSSTYVPHHTHYAHEISHLHNIPTYYSRETSPSRTVQTTYVVPHVETRPLYSSYVATSHSAGFKPAYDAHKLDSLVSNILGARASHHHTVSHYVAPAVKHVDHHVVSHSATLPREVYTSVKQVHHHEVVAHAAHKHTDNYACGDAQNDVDSMVLDRLEGENQERKEHEEEYINYFTSKVEDDQEEEEEEVKPVKVSKRREILNQRKNIKGSQQFESHQVAEQEVVQKEIKAAPQRNELERKGPYDQKNKQNLSPEKAQQYFNEDEKNLGEFRF